MQIDNSFLADLGLGDIPEEEKQLMLRDTIEILSARIGERTQQSLDESKQDELSKLLETADQQSVTEWLANNLPDYHTIVAEEVERVKEEIRPQVPAIVAEFASESNPGPSQ